MAEEIKKGDKKSGAAIGVVVVLVLILAGVMFFMGDTSVEAPVVEEVEMEVPDEGTVVQEDIEAGPELSDSIDIEDLEADLESSSLDDLDREFEDIEQELSNI